MLCRVYWNGSGDTLVLGDKGRYSCELLALGVALAVLMALVHVGIPLYWETRVGTPVSS